MNKFFFIPLLLAFTNSWALDLKGHQFTDSYRYSLLEDSYSEKFNGDDIFLGSLAFVNSPFYFTDGERTRRENEIIEYNQVLTLGYTRYISTKWAMGIDFTALQNKVYEDSFTSFGDVNLRAKFLLTDRGDDFSLSLNPFVTLPTGKKENFSTARSVTAGLRGVIEKHLNRWHALGSVGYSHAPRNEFQIVDLRNLLLTQLGLSYDVNESWNINAEATRNFTIASDERQDEGDYFLTLKNKTTDQLSLYGGLGFAGSSEIERDQYTAFLGFKWQEMEQKVTPAKAQPPLKRVAKSAPVIAAPVSRKEESLLGTVIDIDNVYFANNSFVVTPVEREKVMKVVKAYQKLGSHFRIVVIEGFASKKGDSAKNEVLSQSRTKQVMNILKLEGIPESMISLVSYGDQAEQDPEEWKNRRVQFRIYKK